MIRLIFLLIFVFPLFAQDVSYETALDLYKQGEYKKSVSVIKALHIAGQKSFQSFYLEAHNNIKLKHFKTATSKLESALLIENNPAGIIDLVKLLLKRDHVSEARELAEKSIITYPQNLDLRMIHAMTLYRSKKPKGALFAIEQIKAMDQGKGPLLMEAMIYYRLGEYEKSEMSLKWVLEIDENNSEAMNNLALVYEKIALRLSNEKDKRSKLEDARFYLEKAKDLDSENKAIIGNLSRISERLNES